MGNENQNLSKKERREIRRHEKAAELSRRAKSKTYKRVAFWGAVLLVFGGAVFGAVRFASLPGNNFTVSVLDAVSEQDWWKGDKDAKVILVEYSDFQCPACASYYPLAKQLTEEFGDKFLFVYRHFPLKQIHKNAEPAARAAEAAGKQGKFWEMHDMIFENQGDWSNMGDAENAFVKYAEELLLDLVKFKEDFDSDEIKARVESDYVGGIGAGVNSTPTFFLNGERITNPRSYEEFKNTVLSGA